MNYNCQCPQEIKTGQTSAMCCNICGKPDDPMWVISENVDKSFPHGKENQVQVTGLIIPAARDELANPMTIKDYKKISETLAYESYYDSIPEAEDIETFFATIGYKIIKI